MDITKRLAEALSQDFGIVDDKVRLLIVDILKEVVDNGHDLGGMGEYGRGWNDSKTQTRMIVKEMMERWKNES